MNDYDNNFPVCTTKLLLEFQARKGVSFNINTPIEVQFTDLAKDIFVATHQAVEQDAEGWHKTTIKELLNRFCKTWHLHVLIKPDIILCHTE